MGTTSTAVTVPALTSRLTATGEVTCAHQDCQTTQLAPGCKRKHCCRHCRQLGGYDGVVTHTVKVPAGGTFASVPDTSDDNFFSSRGYRAPLPPASDRPQASTSALMILPLQPPPQLADSTIQSLNACPDPRYSSQMENVFSEQWGVQQRLSATWRAREAEQLENTRKAKTKVTVHAQVKVHYLVYVFELMLICSCYGIEQRGPHCVRNTRRIHTSLLQAHYFYAD
jgi:hypothetical protein